MDGTNDGVMSRPDAARPGTASFRPVFLFLVLAFLAFALPRGQAGQDSAPASRPTEDPEPEAEVQAPSLLPATDLIYRVPARLRPSCSPLDNSGAPLEILDCSEDLTRVYYVRYADVAAMDLQFDQTIAPFNLPVRPGGCRAGVPSQEQWYYSESRDQPEGRMACYLLPPDIPVTIVTQPEARLLSIVISNPSMSWSEHFEKWRTMVPNPPPDQPFVVSSPPPLPVPTAAPEG